MDNLPLLFEMYWMRDQAGTFIMKIKGSSAKANLKGIADAVGFVGRLAQLGKAIESGADQNGHFALDSYYGAKNWILHYNACKGRVSLVLMVKRRGDATFKHSFVWDGNALDFVEAVKQLQYDLPKYPYYIEDRLKALTDKWSSWVKNKLAALNGEEIAFST